MTHLAVAKEINDKIGIAQDLSSYFLGAIAPDAVHIREDFNGDMKVSSHYCVEGDAWGQVASGDAWSKQAFRHIKSLADGPNRDFYLGYFIHVLADASNHEKMWLPFLEHRLAEGVPLADVKGLVSEDYDRIDWILYDNYEWQNKVLDLLELAKGIDVIDRVKAWEIDEYKDILIKMYRLNIDFMDLINARNSSMIPRPMPTLERKLPVYVTVEDMLKFVTATVDEICRSLNITICKHGYK